MVHVVAAIVGSAGCVVSSPYLARLVATVPDRANRAWWRGAPVSSPRRVSTGLVAGTLGALAGTSAGLDATLPALVALALVATPMTIIDVERHRLPDRLIAPMALTAVVLFAVAALVTSDWTPYVRALEAAALVFGALFALAFARPDGFGFGDVKLGAVLAVYLGWFGWRWVYFGLFAGFLAGGIVGLILIVLGRAGRRTAIPFGPMLVAGTFTALALHASTTLIG